jgi:hypothetical protein
MNLSLTLALFALGAVLTALFGWLGARPRTLGKPRLAPWQFLMMIAGAGSMMMLVHLLNLVGAHTGGA